MKPIRQQILPAAIAMAVLPLVAACGGDAPAAPVEENAPMFVSFTISIDNPDGNGSNTRAADDWTGKYPEDDGYSFDNRLNSTCFYPVLYKVGADNSLSPFLEVSPLALLGPTESVDGSKTYFSFTGVIDLEKCGTDFETLSAMTDTFRLMIYANEYFSEGATIDGNSDFEHIGNEGKPGFYGIPMWGVTDFKFNGIEPGKTLILDEIPLLRAMAMVRVKLENPTAPGSDDPQDVKLLGLNLSRYNTKGLTAPGKWNDISSTNSLRFEDTPRYLTSRSASAYSIRVGKRASSENESPDMLTQNGAEVYNFNSRVTDNLICFYLPEVENDNSEQLVLEVAYTLNGGEEQTWPLYFCRYEDGKPIETTGAPEVPGIDGNINDDNTLWHIVRNHIYEYTITGVQDSRMTIETRVKDWQYHKSSTELE